MDSHTCSACDGDPPVECPQCDTVIIGATWADWREHFKNDCNPLGALYCFASEAVKA